MSEGEVVVSQLRMRGHALHSQLILPAGGRNNQLIASALQLDDQLTSPGGGDCQLEFTAGLVAPVSLRFNNLGEKTLG